MQRPERDSWLRRDGGPLAVSLVLHVAALLLIAPWLVMRSIPEPPIEVEVMLEPAEPTRQRARQDPAARRPVATRPDVSPAKPVPIRTVEVELETVPDETRQAPIPDESAGGGLAGSGQPSLAEAAGLSGSQAGTPAASTSAAEPAAATALGRAATPSSQPVTPSAGTTPQPSSRSIASQARPGEERQDARLALAGPASQARAQEPEFRQAARLGGAESISGGSRAPDSGLSTQPGSLNQTAMQRSQAVAAAAPAGGTRGPALAAVVPNAAARSSAVAGDSSSPAAAMAQASAVGRSAVPAVRAPAAGALSATARPQAGRGAATVDREGLSAAQAKAGGEAAGRSVAPASRVASAGALSAAAQPRSGGGAAISDRAGSSPLQGKAGDEAVGRSAAPVSRTPDGGGLSTAGQGMGRSGAVPPGERGVGMVAAASPGVAGPLPGAAGAAGEGEGSGSGERGEGRATLLAGSGSSGRDSGALQKASGSGTADAVVDGGQGQLSSSPETQSLIQAASEERQVAMQVQRPSGQARVVEERFSAVALKVESPATICHLPLMLAGFDRHPIPKGLDTINASQPMVGEIPPRHHPNNLTPGYPAAALLQRAEGRALVRAEIRPDGRVGQLWIKQTSGFQLLDHAAIETVRSWRFYPAKRHGAAVAMWMDVPIEYKLPQQGVYR